MFWAFGRIAVLIPINSPQTFSKGPPLLPGLIGASVWMSPSNFTFASNSSVRSVALITPVVTVLARPIGLPIAMTVSPTIRSSLRPRRR